MPGEHASAALLGALSKLLAELQHVSLRLEVPGVQEARRRRAEVQDQMSDYVIPRLVQLDAPLLTVVGGSTGAGKSTLVNSLVGSVVTESGVLRPTTRSPVLVHNPADREWFLPDRILPDLPRTNVSTNDTYALRLASSTKVPPGLAILDAPDVDSIDEGNRKLAAQLLAAADLWLFVTSAARYADQVPWDYLRMAAERSASVAVVLDRTPDEAVVEVRGHLARMMTSRGLSDSPLFTVPEAELDDEGLLPSRSVEPIVTWLHDLAGDSAARALVVGQTIDGAIRHNVVGIHDVVDAMGAQLEAAAELQRQVETAYDDALESVARRSVDGTLLRGELLGRWQEFVGSGEILRSVEEKVSRIRDRVMDGVTGKRTRSSEVGEAIERGLQMLLVEQAEAAAEAATRSWASTAAGRALLDQTRGLDGASRELRTRAERTVRDWQQGILELVRAEGSDKRMTARFLAFGVSGISVMVEIVMFAREAGAAGADTGETAAIGRRLLEAIFGEDGVGELLSRTHADLTSRVDTLLDAERQRYLSLLDAPETIVERQGNLRDAARLAEYARHADFLNGEMTS